MTCFYVFYRFLLFNYSGIQLWDHPCLLAWSCSCLSSFLVSTGWVNSCVFLIDTQHCPPPQSCKLAFLSDKLKHKTSIIFLSVSSNIFDVLYHTHYINVDQYSLLLTPLLLLLVWAYSMTLAHKIYESRRCNVWHLMFNGIPWILYVFWNLQDSLFPSNQNVYWCYMSLTPQCFFMWVYLRRIPRKSRGRKKNAGVLIVAGDTAVK